jgi:hypothetical protein
MLRNFAASGGMSYCRRRGPNFDDLGFEWKVFTTLGAVVRLVLL